MTYIPPTQCRKCFPTVQEQTAGAMGRCTYTYSHQPSCPNAPRSH